MKYVDLHTHSSFSDGSLTPTELINQAYKNGLSAIALTDHDTVAGINEAREAAMYKNIELIAGVECTSFLNETLHILGYFVNIDDVLFQQELEHFAYIRKQRNISILEKLRNQGMFLSMKELKSEAKSCIIVRSHIASCLFKKHYVQSYQEAFDLYIGHHGSCFVEPMAPHPQKVIELLHKNGAIAVLAHPYLSNSKTEEDYSKLFATLKEYGLDGIEVYHSEHSVELTNMFFRLANHFSFLVTGGSDFHGEYKKSVYLGIGKRNLSIPYSIVVNIKEYLQRKDFEC